ncbi:MAG TPA: hypothetical protein PK788_04930, partial [Gemmatimonadaceae bacterium]|nr:hypothetical protein [Gemmatimonadaceae bacterium]
DLFAWARLLEGRVVRAFATSGWQLVHAALQRAGAWPLVWGEVIGRLASVVAMAREIWRRDRTQLLALRWDRVRRALREQREFVAVATPAHLINQLGQWLPVFLLAVFFLSTRGLNLSIEFTGGTVMEVHY